MTSKNYYQIQATSSDGGTLNRFQKKPKAFKLTFLVFSILWATHFCCADSAVVPTEFLPTNEPITTLSSNLPEEMTTTSSILTTNDSAVQTNSSSSQAISPLNQQQLSLYAIDGDTLDRLFAQYISNVLSTSRQLLMHNTDAASSPAFGSANMVDIRKDQQFKQVVGSGEGGSTAVHEKAVIMLKGSHSQLVINGNLVQYIYNVDSSKCNLAEHHTSLPIINGQPEKPTSSSLPPEVEAPLAVIKSISKSLPVANLSEQNPVTTSSSVPIAISSESFSSSQFFTITESTKPKFSSTSQTEQSTTSNPSTTRTSPYLTTTSKPLVTSLPVSVTESFVLAKSTMSRNRSSPKEKKQSVSTSAAQQSITSTTSTIRPRVSIVVTQMSTTRSTPFTSVALTATTAHHQHDSLISSVKPTSTAKSSSLSRSTSSSTQRRSSTNRPSSTTTSTSTTTAPLTDHLTTISSSSSAHEVNSAAPPFTLTFAPSVSSAAVTASTRLSPSSSSPATWSSPSSSSIFPTLTTTSSPLTRAPSLTSSIASLPGKSLLISKRPLIPSSSSKSTTVPSGSTKLGSSTLSSASSHSLISMGNSNKMNPISLTTVANDMFTNLGSSSVSTDGISSSKTANFTTELSSSTFPFHSATPSSTLTSRKIVLSTTTPNLSSSPAFPFTTLSPPAGTSESILDNTIDVEVNNSNRTTTTLSALVSWSTEKPKLVIEEAVPIMDQSGSDRMLVSSTETPSISTNSSIASSTKASTTTSTTSTSKAVSQKENTKNSSPAVKTSSTKRPSSSSINAKSKVTRYPSPIVSWHRNQSSTPPSTLSVKQVQKTTTRLRPPKTSSTTTRFVPTRFIYPAAPTSPTSPASSTRARLPFDELYEIKRRFIENKRNFFNRILSTTTTRRPVVLFPSFAKWIQGNFRQGRRR